MKLMMAKVSVPKCVVFLFRLTEILIILIIYLYVSLYKTMKLNGELEQKWFEYALEGADVFTLEKVLGQPNLTRDIDVTITSTEHRLEKVGEYSVLFYYPTNPLWSTWVRWKPEWFSFRIFVDRKTLTAVGMKAALD